MSAIPSFNTESIKALLQAHWTPGVKISKGAQHLSAEYMRLFVLEALHRASKDAEQGGATVVQPQNVERILPQLLLDF